MWKVSTTTSISAKEKGYDVLVMDSSVGFSLRESTGTETGEQFICTC